MFLTETFSLSFPSQLFQLYDVFISPGVRLTDAATARFRELFGWKIVLLGMYIPPSNSLYYAVNEIDNGVSLLEQCIVMFLKKLVIFLLLCVAI